MATSGCVGPGGPIAPPLGLGPGLDQVVFFGFLIGIAAIAWPQVRKWTSTRNNPLYRPNQNDKRAIAIATERYAKGEITRDEYLKMLEDLRHQIT